MLDILVQNRRDKTAARRFLLGLMKKTGAVPRVTVTDKLRSYSAAHRGHALRRAPAVEVPEQPGGEQPPANETARTGDERFPFRGRGPAVPSAFSGISPHFRPRRHLMTAAGYRAEMTIRFAIWEQVTGVAGLPTTP